MRHETNRGDPVIRCPMHPRGVNIPATTRYGTSKYCAYHALILAMPGREADNRRRALELAPLFDGKRARDVV